MFLYLPINRIKFIPNDVPNNESSVYGCIMGRSQGTHLNPSIEYVSHKDHIITHKVINYITIHIPCIMKLIVNFKSTIGHTKYLCEIIVSYIYI